MLLGTATAREAPDRLSNAADATPPRADARLVPAGTGITNQMAVTATIRNARRKLNDAANRWRVPLTDGRLGGGDLARRTVSQIRRDHVLSFAKSIAFSGVLALFPLLILVVLLLGILEAEPLLLRLVETSRAAIPDEAYDLLTAEVIPSITSGNQAGLTLGAALSVAVALWGVSGAMRSTMEALNVMYGVGESRTFVAKYLMSLVLAIGAAVLLILAAVLVVAGPALASLVANYTGAGDALEIAWLVLQWPLLAGLVLLAFALLYYFAPNVDQEFRFISPGSLIGFVLWLAFTGLFAIYVNNFGSFSATYGALAGVVVVMLYLMYSALILLVGAEINQVVENASPDGKDRGETSPGERRAPDADEPVSA